MTDGLKTSMSSSLTSTLLMEAASYDYGNAKTQITTRPRRSCWIGKTINANTRICSNHFKSGRPTNVGPHSILYLRECSEQVSIKRKPPADRSTVFASAANCSTQKRGKLTVIEMTETSTRHENKSSSMVNKENCKYKTVGCQVSSKCEETKHLK